jgi:hypothetical protein
MIDFVTVSNDVQKIAPVEESIRAMMAGFSLSDNDWRLRVVDGTKHDVFTGYNAGAAQSGADVLVFLHHDIRLLASAMALQRPLELLRDPSTGFIGVCGAVRLNAFGTWWGDLPQPQVMAGCRGFVGYPDANPFSMNFFSWPGGASVFGQVLVVDGVFLMCHRRTFEKLGGFDDKTFKGFHFYDIDMTLRAHLAGLRNYVAPIPLFHASKGNYDQVWEAARQVFVNKHAGRLPCQL